MEFVKEFATFLDEKGIIRFGDFTLSSGKKSQYYIDLRLVASYPHEFRKMIKQLQNMISNEIGFENFHSLVSVPTGGLVIASSLAIEIVKPLIYVRNKPKEHGTSQSIEGVTCKDMKLLMIDDVATTGDSVINAIKILKQSGMKITDAFVIIDRSDGVASIALKNEGVKLHSLMKIEHVINEISKK